MKLILRKVELRDNMGLSFDGIICVLGVVRFIFVFFSRIMFFFLVKLIWIRFLLFVIGRVLIY